MSLHAFSPFRHHRCIKFSVFLFLLLFPSFFSIHASAKEEQPFVYTLTIPLVHPETVSALSIGAPLIDNVGKYDIGRVGDIAVSPHMTETYNEELSGLVTVPHPLYVDIILTVKAEGFAEENGQRVNGYLLSLGKNVCFSTPFFSGVGECTMIVPAGIYTKGSLSSSAATAPCEVSAR